MNLFVNTELEKAPKSALQAFEVNNEIDDYWALSWRIKSEWW